MIRFRVPADAPERIAFAYSPLLESVLSLHVIVAPKHHPLQHGWVRRARKLSPSMKREVNAFSFAYRHFFPDFLLPSADADFASFEEEVQRFLELDPELVAFEFLRPLVDHGGDRDPRKLRRAKVRAAAEFHARRLGGSPDLALLLFDDVEQLRQRFAALLRQYWDEAFADEWERLEPRLAAATEESGAHIAGAGLYSLLGTLSPKLRVEAGQEQFGLDVPHEHTIAVTEEQPLVLVASKFAWPHVHVQCDEPWPLTLVYPASFVVWDARRRLPDAELLRLLRALGDDTRLRALRLIAERPRSTQELAPLVGISEAGLSKQLRVLAEAGVVEAKRESYYVLYSLRADRLEPLSRALLSFLGRAG